MNRPVPDVVVALAAILLAAVTFTIGIVLGRSDPPPQPTPAPSISQLPSR